jgi:hypothetical protein
VPGPPPERAPWLNEVIPRTADNTYRGFRLALWLLGFLLFIKSAIGVNSIFNGYSVATAADGIPLSEFGPAGARTVVSLFALLGLSQLLISVLGILVLVRYRALVPLLFGLLLVSHLGGRLIVSLRPVATTGRPPGAIVNLVQLGLIVVGLALSLWNRDRVPAPPER